MQFNKNVFCFFIINMYLASTTIGMSHNYEEIEKQLCILHERPNLDYEKPEISPAMHIVPSKSGFTKITHFAPYSEEESNELIQKVCAQYKKIWWFVTPNTKKFSLEQRLQEKGLAPYPLAAMICELKEREFIIPNSVTIRDIQSAETNQDWHDIHAEAFNYEKKDLSKESHESKIEDQRLIHYGLFNNTKLVTIGSLFLQDKWVALLNIATKKTEQKKGFATILMNHLLQVAHQKGKREAILESSPEAITLYKKLGFKELFTTYIYYRL